MRWKKERGAGAVAIIPARECRWRLRATLLCFLLVSFTSLRLAIERLQLHQPSLGMPRKLSGLKPPDELREKIDTSLRLQEWSLRSSKGGGIAGESCYEAPTYHRFTGYTMSIDPSSIQEELSKFISLYSQLLYRAARETKTKLDSNHAPLEAGSGDADNNAVAFHSDRAPSAQSPIKDDNESHTFAFNTMLEACARKQQWGEMWSVMKKLISVGIVGNSWTISLYIQIVDNVGQWKHIAQLYQGLKDSGMEIGLEIYNFLLASCLKYGQWNVAETIYDRIQNTASVQANAKTYNLIIATLEKANQWERALRMYVKMVSSGVMPETSTYNSLMNACRKAGRYNKALIMFQLLKAQNLEPDGTTYAHMNALILASSKTGDWGLTCKVFDEMKEAKIRPDSTTYSALIFALTKKGDVKNGLKQFFQMCEEGVLPSMEAFASVISACIDDKDFNTAREALKQTKSLNLSLDCSTFNRLMEAIEASEGIDLPSSIRNRLALDAWKDSSSLGVRPYKIVDEALAAASLRHERASICAESRATAGRGKRIAAAGRERGKERGEDLPSLDDMVEINRQGLNSRRDVHLLSLSSPSPPFLSSQHASPNTEDQDTNGRVLFTGVGLSPLRDLRKNLGSEGGAGAAREKSPSTRKQPGEDVHHRNAGRISDAIKEGIQSAEMLAAASFSPKYTTTTTTTATTTTAHNLQQQQQLHLFTGVMKRRIPITSHIGIRGGGKKSRTSEDSHADCDPDDGSTHSEVLTDAEWTQFMTVGNQQQQQQQQQ